MDVTKTIAQQFSDIAVGFFHVSEPLGHSAAVAGADPSAWLFDAHTRIDAAIADENGAFDKIKTIGDKVMIAGSFSEQSDTRTAGVAMVRCARRLRDQGLRLHAGFHLGEVMGAVLGTERLCFDIFGDSVNVASRVLTTQQPGEHLTASTDFVELLRSADSTAVSGVCAIAEPVERAVKGKGAIRVCVLATPNLSIVMSDALTAGPPASSSV